MKSYNYDLQEKIKKGINHIEKGNLDEAQIIFYELKTMIIRLLIINHDVFDDCQNIINIIE